MKKTKAVASAVMAVANTGQLKTIEAAVYGVRHCPAPDQLEGRREVLRLVVEQARKQLIAEADIRTALDGETV